MGNIATDPTQLITLFDILSTQEIRMQTDHRCFICQKELKEESRLKSFVEKTWDSLNRAIKLRKDLKSDKFHDATRRMSECSGHYIHFQYHPRCYSNYTAVKRPQLDPNDSPFPSIEHKNLTWTSFDSNCFCWPLPQVFRLNAITYNNRTPPAAAVQIPLQFYFPNTARLPRRYRRVGVERQICFHCLYRQYKSLQSCPALPLWSEIGLALAVAGDCPRRCVHNGVSHGGTHAIQFLHS